MILAIDPGNKGAFAFLHTTKHLVDVVDMPLTAAQTSGHMRWNINGCAISGLLQGYRPTCALLERVASRPGQGVAGVFAFGRGVGTIEGVLQSLEIPIMYVSPQVWKKHHGLIKQPKIKSLELARTLYPDAELHLVKHEGRAEAILMGIWKLDKWRELNA